MTTLKGARPSSGRELLEADDLGEARVKGTIQEIEQRCAKGGGLLKSGRGVGKRADRMREGERVESHSAIQVRDRRWRRDKAHPT